MIDYLISDPKIFWTNLKLYFKSYEFSNFKDLSRIFLKFWIYLDFEK